MASGSAGSLWLGNGDWSKGVFLRAAGGPGPPPWQAGHSRHAGKKSHYFSMGASGEERKLGSSRGPRASPSGQGMVCRSRGGGRAGYCQELRATSPGLGPSLSARGRPGQELWGPPDSGPSLLLTVSSPLIRAPAGMSGPSRQPRVTSPRDPWSSLQRSQVRPHS